MALNTLRPCALRGHYILVGTYLMRAGVRMVGDRTLILGENTGGEISVIDPSETYWLTSRAVTGAVARAGIAVKSGLGNSLNSIQLTPKLAEAVKADPKAGFRLIEDAITAIEGGEQHRAYAKDVVQALLDTQAKDAAKVA